MQKPKALQTPPRLATMEEIIGGDKYMDEAMEVIESIGAETPMEFQ